MNKLFLLMIGIALCCYGVSCGYHALGDWTRPSVYELVKNPRKFIDHETTISGVVGSDFAVMGIGYFQLVGDDGTSLTVLSSQGIPTVGQRISVRGTLHQALAVSSRQMLLFVEASRSSIVPGKEDQH